MKYKHEQTGEIKTIEEWKDIFKDFGASGFVDFESFKSEWLVEVDL